jgi:DNA-binding transcriptional regulator YiaG
LSATGDFALYTNISYIGGSGNYQVTTQKISAYLKSPAAFRERFKLSQSELAALLPVNVRTLQEWESERGRERVPPFLARALRDLAQQLKNEGA